MPADLRAAKQALHEALASAPRMKSPDGTEAAVDVAKAVDAVFRAGQPDALVPPRYDPVLAPDTWHRIALPGPDQPGREICFIATAQGCEIWERVDSGEPHLVGLVGADALDHLGLAACSTSIAQRRLREGA